jgi:FkbM family methyltransferase
MKDVPKDALVVSSLIGRPLTARRQLNTRGLRSLDYFAFQRYAKISIDPVRHWDQFKSDFAENRSRYEWIFDLLADSDSRAEFSDLINFRLSSDLRHMGDRTDRQHEQYFEDFLSLKPEGETFLDAGSFDGQTSLEFIKRCPGYESIHAFEPDPRNMAVVEHRLAGIPNVTFHPYGLSDRSQLLGFEAQGSRSRVSETGPFQIEVRPLDDILATPFTFLKIDIEGEERAALHGAKGSIARHRPRLAISAYHRYDDFWRIPEIVLSVRDDYEIYLRHYTEGVDETVMFFVPR